MDKIKKVMLAVLLCWSASSASINMEQALVAIDEERAALDFTYRAYFPSTALGNQIKAEFHHALLAMDGEQGYLVLTLNNKEITYLRGLNVRIQPALAYVQAREKQLDAVIERLLSTPTQLAVREPSSLLPALQAMTSNAVTIAGIPGFSCYETVEETFAVTNDLVSNHPDLATLIDIGDSWEKQNGLGGYDLLVMKITNSNVVKDKPKLFIHSAMHAREYTTAALTLDFARELLTKYNDNADIHWIVDHHEIHILFHMNPDGRKIAELGILKRKNNNTTHCSGSVQDTGVDLNRNFSFFWRAGNGHPDWRVSDDACSEVYRGPFKGSEPETQAVENYIRQLYPDRRGSNDTDPAPLDTQGLHLDIHSFSNLVLYPYAHTKNGSPNVTQLATLARKLAYFNNYIAQPSPDLYLLDGNSESVSYGELGVPHLTFELGNTFFEQCTAYENTIRPDNIETLIYAAKIVALPYQLPSGPDVDDFKIKGREHPDVSLGSDIVFTATVSDELYNTLNGIEPAQVISNVEYSIDKHFYDIDVMPVVLDPAIHSLDALFDSPTESVLVAIDNAQKNIVQGKHTLYVRSKDADGNYGAISARHFTVISGQYLESKIEVACNRNVCTFDGSQSLDTDGSIARYSWNFGDGYTSTEVSPRHIYTANGNYSVELVVEALDGETNKAIVNHEILLSGESPSSVIQYQCIDLECHFDASASVDPEGDLHIRRWDFGDGTILRGKNVTHIYSAQGSYTVTLRVRDGDGWLTEAKSELNVALGASSKLPSDRQVAAPSGGGGGGSISLLALFFMFLAALFKSRAYGINLLHNSIKI